MLVYNYGILRTDKSAEAEAHNKELLGPETLGIEVTVEWLAAQCGLGNIDPQHTEGGESSAIERACTYSPLPRMGTNLVTIRPDKDSIGAMAILEIRAQGNDRSVPRELIAWIGALDQMGFENARRQFPALYGSMQDDARVRVLNIVTSNDQCWPTIEEKVLQFMKVLTGQFCLEELEEILSQGVSLRNDFSDDVEMYGDGGIAFIEAPGKFREARDWANRRYPVAIIFDPIRETQSGGRHKRYTIVRMPGHFDRFGFARAINIAEAAARGISADDMNREMLTWGGPENIVTSAQGVGRETKLTKEQIIGLVLQYL